MAVAVDVVESLAAKFAVLLPHLDERQQRLYLASEARSLGHGGIAAVARAAGVSRQTVTDGVDELDSGEKPSGRVRRPGAGRKPVTEADPGLLPALLALVEPNERGDPMSPLRWTTKSTRNLADTLTAGGHKVGADTVANLLRQEGFSLQGNAKTLEGKQNPDRDAQFRYLNEQVKDHQTGEQPVVSVDTEKKELVGEFRNAGREWRPAGQPVEVSTHDFPDKTLGKVVPYGIYDLAANTGWVNVGTDHDTAAFAVESIRRWWNAAGHRTYPHATRLLITADAGGSNGYRTRAWETELAALAAQTGLAITVCHFPPGTSKWNKVEHRLFSHITLNWRGRPLTSHEVVLQTIAATTTRTGLTVHSELDPCTYPLGTTISDQQMASLPIVPHDWHGDWNYTLHPDTSRHTTESGPPAPTDCDITTLSDPALTGMLRPELDTVTTALDELRQQHRAKQRHHQHAPRSGRPPLLTFPDQILATILHLRLSLPADTLAVLFSSSRSTIRRAISHTRQLLEQHGTVIQPASLPVPLTQLLSTIKTAS
ncbi:ISAzo13 family transposase [Lentzea sp.]|uniref:ISAzo13 family transposase n=1 Tax=Lentzea sp. TaxID=56099 RepID=UPI002BEB9851|nr:ISAzo13 family transposase [Lentzea sp.]HUQ60788.1 ISAzo13 family transposase [Lentzea sp.]